MSMITCDACKYCYYQDYGYSNYTVEGTEANCLKRLHPDFPKDRFYGEHPALKYAESCSGFAPGLPVDVDVDHNEGDLENYSDDPEVKELLRNF